MPKPKFTAIEKDFLHLISRSPDFTFKGKAYKTALFGKPVPSDGQGESKTDIYLQGINESGNVEIKISIKKSNADFLENKMKLERVKQLFGEKKYRGILKSSVDSISDQVVKKPLVFFKKSRNVEVGSITLGWRFELINKSNGKMGGLIELTDEQRLDVYAGTNTSIEKKNAIVKKKSDEDDGVEIKNSGVANYLLVIDEITKPLDCYLNEMLSLEEFVKDRDIYFACKAVNYRAQKHLKIIKLNEVKKKKHKVTPWEGDRALSVYVDWQANGGKLVPKLILDYPLEYTAHDVGARLLSSLELLGVTPEKFNKLEGLFEGNSHK